MHFKSGTIPLAYLKSAFGTQNNYSTDFSELCIIFGVLMRAVEMYINKHINIPMYIRTYIHIYIWFLGIILTCYLEDVVQTPLFDFPREAFFHK